MTDYANLSLYVRLVNVIHSVNFYHAEVAKKSSARALNWQDDCPCHV